MPAQRLEVKIHGNTLTYRPGDFVPHPIVRAIFAILIVGGVMFAPIAFPFKVPTFAALALAFTWLEAGSLAPLGLGRPGSLWHTLGWALLGAALAIFGIGDLVSSLVERLLGIEPDYSGYGALEGNLPAALKLIGYAMLSAAIGEELVYRGFLLHTLTALFGEKRPGQVLAVLVSATLFAIPHAHQGPVGLAMVFLTGVLMGWLFFRSGRNIYALFLSHAAIDIWGVSHLYLGA